MATGLPSVTMSGSSPRRSNPHRCEPLRPSPYCTSSATMSAPAARRRAEIAAPHAGGGSKIDAITGVLASGLLSGLVTDEKTARALAKG